MTTASETRLSFPFQRTLLSALLMVSVSGVAVAQVRPPDSGLLQKQREPLAEPPSAPASAPSSHLNAQHESNVEGVARAVPIRRVVVEGSTVITQEQWDERLLPVTGRSLTLPQMRAVALQVQAVVQAAGRPFSIAYLPPQDLSSQQLLIRVVEGRYGQVRAKGDLADAAGPWLTPLQAGRPIGPELERQVRLLSELPGVEAVATVSPGVNTGEADVDLDLSSGRRWGGELRTDNHGNRYTGALQMAATGYVNHLLTLGDRLTGVLAGSQGGGLQGNVDYGLPIGTRGVRLNLSAGRSRYELGKEFDVLGASGNVGSLAASVAVPLVLSARTRVDWQSSMQRQSISNEQALFEIRDKREVLSWRNALQVSHWMATGGVFWGSVAVETGRVRLRDALSQEFDAVSAKTAGGYLLMSADASALKPLGDWSLFGRVAVQLAGRNLDPSRKLTLGGVGSVRAWPASEGAGDDGVLVQTEVRRRIGDLSPFVFFDAGQVQVNHAPWVSGSNYRSLAGTGVGVRWASGPWQLQGTAGWRMGADRRHPVSDPSASSPQLWLSLGYVL